MTKLDYFTFGIILLLLIAGGYGIFSYIKDDSPNNYPTATLTDKPQDRIQELVIQSGETFGITLERGEIGAATSSRVVLAATDVYDLASIRAGNIIYLIYDAKTDLLKKIVYEIGSEEELIITTDSENAWDVEKIDITYDIEVARVEGAITSSFYNAAQEKGADDAIIIEFATVYQWTIDFGIDTQEGDTFNFIYEKRYRDGEYIDTGRVLAGEYTTRGQTYRAYFFDNIQDNIGYFNENGDSLKKEFLKAPVAFKYITSGFTTGSRYIAAFNVSTGHRAIDYAAPYGTPVRSVGVGTVTSAGWNGSFGNFISIHHNDTYTTNYAHLSRIRVSRGQKVGQGDIISFRR